MVFKGSKKKENYKIQALIAFFMFIDQKNFDIDGERFKIEIKKKNK